MEDKWAVFSFGAFADFPEYMDHPAVFSLGVFSDEIENTSREGDPEFANPRVIRRYTATDRVPGASTEKVKRKVVD
jgi:hypothetical protein